MTNKIESHHVSDPALRAESRWCSFNRADGHQSPLLRQTDGSTPCKRAWRVSSGATLAISVLTGLSWCGCAAPSLSGQTSELSSFHCAPVSVAAAETASCQVNLTAPAPSGGLRVHLSSNNEGVRVPTSVVVAAGKTSAPFAANIASSAAGTTRLTGSFNGLSTTPELAIASSTAITVRVAPGPVMLNTGAVQQFTAAVFGSSNTAVAWSVTGSGCRGTRCGTISSAGLYTAPAVVPTPNTVLVTATSLVDGTSSGSTTVQVMHTYYLAPASAGGNDGNDGRSASAPWLTPHHSVQCGDLIIAAPGSYDAGDFNVGSWGTVTCPAANSVAWLKCLIFDTCLISTHSMSAGMWIDRSFWGVQGWEVTTQPGSTEGSCFVVAPNWNHPIEVHHVILANNIANVCQSGGISTANHPGRMVGVDYLVVAGNIAYNSTQGNSECFTGISVYAPIASDSAPGTHIYLAGNFAWKNWDPDHCGGGAATDGEGLMFDELDGSNQNLPTPYAQQVVAENNILIGNGGPGLQVDHNNAGSGPWATVYTRHNTMWGNNHDLTLAGYGHGELLLGEVNNTHSWLDLAVTDIASGGSGSPDYGFYMIDSPTSTDSVAQGWAYSATGTNAGSAVSPGFSYAPSNILGVNPQLANPTVPGGPHCRGSANVTDCMAPVIADFAPNDAAAKPYGYQKPSRTPNSNSLFPQWLCTVNDFPAGLVTMGCVP